MAPRIALLLLLCTGCQLGASWPSPGGILAPSPAARSPAPAAPAPLRCGALPRQIGQVQAADLDEISGVVESHRDPRVLFVHNDSGDGPRFFAIDRSGRLLAELQLESVPRLVDAEDIAIGPGPGGGSYVYLGDTGNNFASSWLGIPRRKAVVYRVPEPQVSLSGRRAKLTISNAFPIVFTFPDGARNVEALFVDPRNGDMIFISKERDGVSQVLSASAAILAAGGGELQRLGELHFGRPPLPGNHMPTGASISRDGSSIVVRSYSSIFLFRRALGQDVMSALSQAPRVLPSPREAQGEAIGFVAGDTAVITLSEGVMTPIICQNIP